MPLTGSFSSSTSSSFRLTAAIPLQQRAPFTARPPNAGGGDFPPYSDGRPRCGGTGDSGTAVLSSSQQLPISHVCKSLRPGRGRTQG